jgi:hypothetical protein
VEEHGPVGPRGVEPEVLPMLPQILLKVLRSGEAPEDVVAPLGVRIELWAERALRETRAISVAISGERGL